ncbi:MAG: toxin-antitoxin system HicB family antitoxin [Bryobacterales bacterium]|nr:toxin-antitoxin system HicB family antitoxin [Bryobacterales bacterium]
MGTISNSASKRSGRFVLRMPPELHATLHEAARTSGLSLNAYCVRQLAAAGVGGSGDADAMAVVTRAREVAGIALLAVVLHGSWVRGEATHSSDVDALIVVDSRLALTRALYRAWDERPVTWRARRVDPHFAHPPVDGEFSGLWAELAVDGIVVFEQDWRLSAHLARIRRSIAGGRLVRQVVHGQPYWTDAA